MQDIASVAGVSKMTVSDVLNGKNRAASAATRDNILRIARELKYAPNPNAQRLSNGGCRNTISIFSFNLDLGVTTLKLQIIQQLLSKQGFDVPIYTYGTSHKSNYRRQGTLMGAMRRQRPRAIVCANFSIVPEVAEELMAYMDEGGVVITYDSPSSLPCDQVIFDRQDNAYQAVRHLVELGHRDIAFFINASLTPDNPRFLGVQQALNEKGLKLRPECIFEMRDVDDGRELAERFLALHKRPTGIYIVNETIAAVFVSQVLSAGLRVPQDISVVSSDNTPISECCAVPMTTVSQPTQEIGGAVVKMLCSRLDGSFNEPPSSIVIRGQLLERASTSRPGEKASTAR
jgi:LacI family transcriptional regulator